MNNTDTMPRLVLFTKPHEFYAPFIQECVNKFSEILVITSDRQISTLHGVNCTFHSFKSDTIRYQKLIEAIKDFNGDLLISFCYNRIIHDDILGAVPLCINFHGSLLPNYAGAHALNWQIINGMNQSGVTIHQLTSEVDGGKILLQHKFKILATDDANDVLRKLISCSCGALHELMKYFKDGELSFKEQIKVGGEFACRKRTALDGELTADMSSLEIYNMCRALVEPWPGAFYTEPSTDEKIVIREKINMKKAELIVKILKG